MNTNDWDKLGKILEKWTIEDAYTVLDELYWRLDLITQLEDLSDEPTTDELHQLQPIFENGYGYLVLNMKVQVNSYQINL
jgi:hypothetical protein